MNPTKLDQRLLEIMTNPSYRLAYMDTDYIGREELRPLRLNLELLKPEMLLDEAGIESTVVVFGGTQVAPADEAEALMAEAVAAMEKEPDSDTSKRLMIRAERVVAKARYYEECREFAKLVSTHNKKYGDGEFIIKTGGGPGIMEAANRGAYEADSPSIGLNITLPFEQTPNPYITPGFCFQFNYFAIRKMHFLLRAKALVCFPGGFGTLDELFTTLTLRQTGRMQEIPIILYSREYWENIINFQFLADEGVIRDEHMELFQYTETPEETWQVITDFHGIAE
ncbi:MAG: LOG family protein [Mariniblastus sp.]|nr:LOG family protein [Mariniblastus sp.]